jgi:hypothetical protein
MNFFRFLGLVALLVTFSSGAFAQDAKTVTKKGYVVDKMCSAGIMKKADPMERAAKHTKSCSLEEHCASSGYGIVSDGKWMAFDEKGSAKAKAAIESTKREKGLYYEVSGTVSGDVFTLASLKEAAPDAPKK